MILKISLFGLFTAAFLFSCERKKPVASGPPKEIRELMAHGKKVDALMTGFHDEMTRLFPEGETRPELSNGSFSGFHFWLEIKEGSQLDPAMEALSKEMDELGISEIKVVCHELVKPDGTDLSGKVLRSKGVFRLEKSVKVTQLPLSEASDTGETPEEWLEKANEAAKQRAVDRARDRLNPFH